MLIETPFGKKTDDGYFCGICPHECFIKEGNCGFCGTHLMRDGKLVTVNYGEVSSLCLDPVEKKPLYHFFPGRKVLSIGTVGCNARCPYCQNWHISQNIAAPTKFYSPESLLPLIKDSQSIGIAYTYSEPIVWYEYVFNCSRLMHEHGFKNVMVTNGCINSKPLDALLPYVDAWNIDLKSFSSEVSKKVHKLDLPVIMENIERISKKSHVEITTLIVPGINDDINELDAVIDWISSIRDTIPWHISRYFPNYKYTQDPTDIEFIKKVYTAAKKKLKYVYMGNIAEVESNTQCYNCGKTLVERAGYSVKIAGLNNNVCSFCGADAYFVQ